MFRIKSDLIYEEYGDCPDNWPFWPHYSRGGYIVVSTSAFVAEELRNKLNELQRASNVVRDETKEIKHT